MFTKSPKQKKLKVLRIISRLNIGGPSIHVALLCSNLNPAKFESRLITGSISPTEGDMGYLIRENRGAVLTLPELQREIALLKDVIAFFKILKIILREKPHIIHTHTAKAGAIGRFAGVFYRILSGRKVALVHTFHGNVFEGYFGALKSRLFVLIERINAYFTDTVIAISPSQKWELVTKYRIADPKKVRIFNLGFDLSHFVATKVQNQGAFRKKWALGENLALIGIVGRLVPIKNHQLFLDAAKRLVEANDAVAFKFVVIGDGELRQCLEAYARDIGLVDQVLFCGWETDVSKVYADLDILALTSLNEGTPVSIIEAMAAGVPVITTEVGGIRDLIGEAIKEVGEGATNGFKVCQRGIMCPSNDPMVFANAMQFMVADQMSQKAEQIVDARHYALEHYSYHRLVRDIEALYAHLRAA